jgi:hypothetical protein
LRIISSFLCNFYHHLLPCKEATSSQCRHGNSQWWDEWMMYFLRLLAHNFRIVRCSGLRNRWSPCFLSGVFLILCSLGHTRVAPLPCTPKLARCETSTWTTQYPQGRFNRIPCSVLGFMRL